MIKHKKRHQRAFKDFLWSAAHNFKISWNYFQVRIKILRLPFSNKIFQTTRRTPQKLEATEKFLSHLQTKFLSLLCLWIKLNFSSIFLRYDIFIIIRRDKNKFLYRNQFLYSYFPWHVFYVVFHYVFKCHSDKLRLYALTMCFSYIKIFLFWC